MSAIGDYIHYRLSHYVNPIPNSNYSFPRIDDAYFIVKRHQDTFNKAISNMNSTIIPQLQKEIAKKLILLNKFQLDNKNQNESFKTNEVLDTLFQEVQNELENKWFRVDIEAAAAKGLFSTAGYKAGTKKNSNVIEQVNNNLVKTLNRVLKDIQNLLTEQLVPIETIKKQINISQGRLDTFVQNLQMLDSAVDPSKPQTKKVIHNIFVNIEKALRTEDQKAAEMAVELINRFIAGISSAPGAATDWKGDLPEAATTAFINSVTAVGERVTLKSVDKAINVAHTSRTQKGIHTNLFKEEYVDDFSKQLKVNTNKKEYSFGDFIIGVDGSSGADTVDVELQMKNKSSIGLSIKNLSSSTWVNRGSKNYSANFYYLMQNENYDDFLTHYFNYSATFRRSGSVRKDKNGNPTDINYSAYINNWNQIWTLMKRMLVAKLITGYNILKEDNSTTKTAKVLVAYDEKGEQGVSVKLYPMEKVLRSLFAHNRYGQSIQNFDNAVPNIWNDSGAEARVHKIIMYYSRPVQHVLYSNDLQNIK